MPISVLDQVRRWVDWEFWKRRRMNIPEFDIDLLVVARLSRMRSRDEAEEVRARIYILRVDLGTLNLFLPILEDTHTGMDTVIDVDLTMEHIPPRIMVVGDYVEKLISA
jgi:hypothetical protein